MTAERHHQVLSALRQDLKIFRGVNTTDGFPTWQLFDPVANQFFTIGWLEFEILVRWSLYQASDIVQAITEETTLRPSLDDIAAMATFLKANHLCVPDAASDKQACHQSQPTHVIYRLIKFCQHYFFVKLNLCYPDRYLSKTLAYVRFLLSRRAMIAFAVILMLSLYLVSRQWSEFIATFNYFFSWQGMAYYALAIIGIKLFHELGHAYVAKYFGCHVNVMGIAFIVFWPVLFTDVTDAWRLSSRRQKMLINAAGMISEIMIASIALLVWSLVDAGPLKSVCYFIATTSIIVTLSINLNPLLRFDGYYLLADGWGISNLQRYSSILGQWWLGKCLFGLDNVQPVLFNRRTTIWLILYAYAAWLYRLFVLIAIAILTYYLFFKLLGILLMMLVLVMFILIPVVKQLWVYKQRLQGQAMNKQIAITVSIVFLLLLVLLIPWRSTVTAPAVIHYRQDSLLYTQYAARVSQIFVKPRQSVMRGQVLVKLISPSLDYQIAQVHRDIELLRLRRRQDEQRIEKLGYLLADAETLAQKRSEYVALLVKKQHMLIKAPFAGVIVDISPDLLVGAWVASGQRLLELINPQQTLVEAYLSGAAVNEVSLATPALFYHDGLSRGVPLKIRVIDGANTQKLPYPGYLSSLYGGDIPVITSHQQQLIPRTAIYRVVSQPIPSINLTHIMTGYVTFKIHSRSILRSMGHKIMNVWIRETGF